MTRKSYLIVTGRDTWSDRKLDRIEALADAEIVKFADDGRGGMRYLLSPRRRPTAAQKTAILKAIKAEGAVASWSL